MPPTRSVVFNSMLAINDGLLIERYIVEEHLCYTDAARLLDTQVNLLKDAISEQGEVEIVGVGVLSDNGEGGYNFEPRKGGIMTPSFYALEYTPISTIGTEESAGEYSVKNDAPEDKKRNYVIRINRAAVNYLTAAVMAIMFYFLLAPIGISQSGCRYTASVVPEVITKESKPATIAKEVAAKAEIAPTAIKVAPTMKEEVPRKEITPASIEYVIVMASAVGKKHAEEYVDHLKGKGMVTARVIETNTMRRVVIGHFTSENEARNYLHSLSNDERYADCWVMKL